MNGIDKLFEHMERFHPDSQYWGDSGDMVSVHLCFLCGLNLIKSPNTYKTIEEQEMEVIGLGEIRGER